MDTIAKINTSKPDVRTFFFLVDKKGNKYFYSNKPSPHFQMSITYVVRAMIVKDAPSGCIIHKEDKKPVVGHCYYSTTGKVIEVTSVKPYQGESSKSD